MTYQYKNKSERSLNMEKKKIDQCVKVAREINEEKKMCEEQIVLLWNMLSDENKAYLKNASIVKCMWIKLVQLVLHHP